MKTVKELTSKNMIVEECEVIKQLLLRKNERYGDSALKPVTIFSNVDPVEGIKLRMDDKISRIVRGKGKDNEDAELDLLGYIVLLRVARKMANFEASKKMLGQNDSVEF